MNIHERIEKWQVEDGVYLFHKMKLPDNSVFIDFGCGYGEYTISLALSNKDCTVYAVDKNKKMLEIVQTKNRDSFYNKRTPCQGRWVSINRFP